MKDREIKLLIAFVAIIFAMVHFYGYKVYSQKVATLEEQIGELPSDTNLLGTGLFARREMALQNSDRFELKQQEMEWLAEVTPEPRDGLTVQSELAKYVIKEAEGGSLAYQKPKIMENDTSGVHFHKAIFTINVTGMESDLYKWLTELNTPEALRAVTSLQMEPNEDDTKIDALVQVEQWYTPIVEE